MLCAVGLSPSHLRVLNSLGSDDRGQGAAGSQVSWPLFSPKAFEVLQDARIQALKQRNKQTETLPKICDNQNPLVNWIVLNSIECLPLSLCIIVLKTKTAQISQSHFFPHIKNYELAFTSSEQGFAVSALQVHSGGLFSLWVLCAFLSSTHRMPVESALSPGVTKHIWTLPNVPWGT